MNVVHQSTALFQALDEQIRQFELARRPGGRRTFSSGYTALDRILPHQGLSRGSLVEWLAAKGGSGATTLALSAARQACGQSQTLVVVDGGRCFYPPAAAGLGIDIERLVLVRPDNQEDQWWAIDQSLRCEGVGAVLCWPHKLDDHTFRRWQLAAETSGAMGLLIRPEQARREPSWAELRLLVTPQPAAATGLGMTRRITVTVLRSRGAATHAPIELDLHADLNSNDLEPGHEPHCLPSASALAAAAIGPGSAGVERPAGGAL